MVYAKKAAVRPRVILPNGDGVMLLEDAVRARLDAEEWGPVKLTSLAGAGKSTVVDLRGAIYTAEQEAHLRSCRAILEARV